MILAFVLSTAALWPALSVPPQAGGALAHEAYRAQMAAAESALRLGDHADGRGWLDATVPERRGFEWRVRDVELDQALNGWSVSSGVRSLAVSPDGRVIACGRVDGTLALHDAETFASLASVEAHDEAITQVRYDRAGARLVTCSFDRTVKVWGADDLSLSTVFEGHGHPVGGVDFSPDGETIASCSYERPPETVVGTIHRWRPGDGTLLSTLEGGRKPLVGLSYSPEGDRIAAGSWDFCVFVWETSGGEPLTLAVPDEGRYNAVDDAVWSPDGRLVAGACKDRTARVWDASTGELVATLRGHTDAVSKLAFTSAGDALATASRDGTLRLWNSADWSERALLLGHADDVVGLAFAPDGSRLWSCATDGSVRVWDATTTWYSGPALRASDACYVVRFAPDGHRLASCSYDGRVHVWSTDTLELLASWQAHPREKSCHALDWSRDGRLLFSGSYDGTVAVWDSVTQEERGRLEHEGGVYWLEVSPDGRLLAAASGDRVFVWEVADGTRVATFEGHTSSVMSVSFSPDAVLCASAGRDGKAIVWEARSGEVRYEVTGVGPDVAEAKFTPDGAYLVVGGRGGQLALHHAADGAKARDLVRSRHGYSHFAISPDGARVALAANTACLVDLEQGGIVGQLRAHLEGPYDVAFDPAGERLASCATDGSVSISETTPLPLRLERSRAMARRVAALERELSELASPAAIGARADRVWSDEELGPVQRAAWVQALTRRAAAVEGPAPGPDAPLFFSAVVDGNCDLWSIEAGTLRRLTTHPGVDNLPVPSPDGSWIAFQSQRDGGYDIFVQPRDGSAPARKLASGDAHDGLPVWSPDGEELAFFSSRDLPVPEPGTLAGHVYRVKLDGSGLRRITEAPLGSTVGPSAWTGARDGLLYSRRRDGTGLDLIRHDLATGVEHTLTGAAEDEYGAVLSPDGERVAFYQESESRCDVVVMGLDGQGRRLLTSAPGWHYVQCWSPDGEWLAVLSYTEDFAASRTWALRVADGSEASLETSPGARDLKWAAR